MSLIPPWERLIAKSSLEDPRATEDSALRAEFLRLLPARAQVLDAGCGEGWDLEALSRAGCQAQGIELSEEVVARARARGLSVRQANLLLHQPPPESLDGIWCHRVFQELKPEECQRALALFFRALKPRTGILFLSAPEPSGEAESQAESGPRGFSEKALGSLLRQGGFRVLLQARSTTQARPTDPASALSRSWLALFCARL
jgi:SAM-dependent methyltransferase